MSPGWCGSVDWASACELKGHQFDSWPGHMPGLWARSPVGGATNVSLPVFLLPFLSLKRNKIFKKKKERKKERKKEMRDLRLFSSYRRVFVIYLVIGMDLHRLFKKLNEQFYFVIWKLFRKSPAIVNITRMICSTLMQPGSQGEWTGMHRHEQWWLHCTGQWLW